MEVDERTKLLSSAPELLDGDVMPSTCISGWVKASKFEMSDSGVQSVVLVRLYFSKATGSSLKVEESRLRFEACSFSSWGDMGIGTTLTALDSTDKVVKS